MNKLKGHKAAGPDEILAEHLNEGGHYGDSMAD